MIERHDLHQEFPTWADGSSAGSDVRERELALERRVSEYIRSLPFLWLDVDDEPGPESRRAYLERNLIALLSNHGNDSIDPRNATWLGQASPSEAIRRSGLWNVDHVASGYDPGFLDTFESYVRLTASLE